MELNWLNIGNVLTTKASTFNNLSLDEFKVLLGAKPSWQAINSAYRFVTAVGRLQADIESRMDLNSATVIF